MNSGQIDAEIGRLLNDPNNTRWTAAVLLVRKNEAQGIVQGYTQAVKTKETLTPTASTQEVTLDADTMDITRVAITLPNGDIFPLEGTTRKELDYLYPNWQNLDAGRPGKWFYDATNQQLNLVRKPDSDHAITNGLFVWEVRKPADLSSDSDVPFDSNNQMIPYHLSIVHWVVAQCWLDDGTPEALAKSQYHRSGMLSRPGEFEKQILRIREDFDDPVDVMMKVKWRPQGGRVGRWGYATKSDPLGWS